MTADICRPREHLQAATHFYPAAWKQYEMFRADRGRYDLPDWPDWCYCPLAAGYAIVSGGGDNRIQPGPLIVDVARLGALAAWRATQGIYRFDPALYARLIDTPISGDIPVDVLYRLPEWCVYIETPDLSASGYNQAGFFAHLEWDANTGRVELRLLLDLDAPEGPALVPVPLHVGRWPLAEAVDRALAESQKQARLAGIPEEVEKAAAENLPDLAPMLSLVLYLCADDADYGASRPARPRPKKTKKGLRLFPPNQPRSWDVGVRLGAALRRAYTAMETEQPADRTDTGRARPRAHVRRAHWHTYRTGKGRHKHILKWVPPIPVNVDLADDLPATIRPVKD